MSTRFMAAEPLIRARLASTITLPRLQILGAAELADVRVQAQHVPAIHVVYDGIAELKDDAGLVTLAERWLTVVCVRNVASAATGEHARAEAGPLLDAVFAALWRWSPAGFKPLRPVVPPGPGFDAGFGYFPLAWLSRQIAPASCPA